MSEDIKTMIRELVAEAIAEAQAPAEETPKRKAPARKKPTARKAPAKRKAASKKPVTTNEDGVPVFTVSKLTVTKWANALDATAPRSDERKAARAKLNLGHVGSVGTAGCKKLLAGEQVLCAVGSAKYPEGKLLTIA